MDRDRERTRGSRHDGCDHAAQHRTVLEKRRAEDKKKPLELRIARPEVARPPDLPELEQDVAPEKVLDALAENQRRLAGKS